MNDMALVQPLQDATAITRYPIHVFQAGSNLDETAKRLSQDTQFPKNKPGIVVIPTVWELDKDGYKSSHLDGQKAIDHLKMVAEMSDIENREAVYLLNEYRGVLQQLNWFEKQWAWVNLLTTYQVRKAAKKAIGFGELYEIEMMFMSMQRPISFSNQLALSNTFLEHLRSVWKRCLAEDRSVLIPGHLVGLDGLLNMDTFSTLIKDAGNLKADEGRINDFCRSEALRVAVIAKEALRCSGCVTWCSSFPESGKLQEELMRVRQGLRDLMRHL